MSNKWPYLVYPDKPVPDCWDEIDGQDISRTEGLRRMCDFGVDQYSRGVCDCIAFNVMPAEVDFVRDYMQANHPGVFFVFGTGSGALHKARENWERTVHDGSGKFQ